MGEGFTFDTSGTVWLQLSPDHVRGRKWEDLSPFVQGYVEGLFADFLANKLVKIGKPPAFSDLSPAALAMILADCAVVEPTFAHLPVLRQVEGGRDFWTNRQNGHLRRYHLRPFAPLTASLTPDGKINLKEAGR